MHFERPTRGRARTAQPTARQSPHDCTRRLDAPDQRVLRLFPQPVRL